MGLNALREVAVLMEYEARPRPDAVGAAESAPVRRRQIAPLPELRKRIVAVRHLSATCLASGLMIPSSAMSPPDLADVGYALNLSANCALHTDHSTTQNCKVVCPPTLISIKSAPDCLKNHTNLKIGPGTAIHEAIERQKKAPVLTGAFIATRQNAYILPFQGTVTRSIQRISRSNR